MGWTADYRVKDIYKEVETDLSAAEFGKFVSECNETLLFAMFNDNIVLSLPNMGYLSVQKTKPKLLNEDGTLRKKGLRPDWGGCRKLWAEKYPDKTWEEIKAIKRKPMVYHKNRHTNGYVYSIVWDMLTTPMKGKNMYEFKAAREFTRYLSGQLKAQTVDFYEM
jgi:hypothetical protein